MAIYRGPGGSGDATGDASNASQLALEAAESAAASAALAASYTPSQTGNAGKFLSTNGSNTFWDNVSSVTAVTSVTGTSPISSSGGLTPAISISQATTSTNGYLSSTDWNTFNNKTSNVGTVTSASIVSANGFAGTVANATTTPAITLSTSITGLLKGNGTAISAATSGTDYAPATSGSSILYGNGSGGFSNVTIGTGLTFSSGTLTASSSGLSYFTSAYSSSSPNATVTVSSLTVTGAATNIDAAFVPKGTGAVLAAVPDSTTTGGNKRGDNAVDLQTVRGSASQVAAGLNAVISGGANNTVGGQNNVISGGISNLIQSPSQGNIISGGSGNNLGGSYCSILGGLNNTGDIDASYSTIGGGRNNQIYGNSSVIAGGYSNTINNVTSTYSTIGGGASNVISGNYSSIVGGFQATDRGLYGASTRANGIFTGNGDAQVGSYIARRETTTATATVLTFDGLTPSTTNQLILANDSTYFFTVSVVARRTDVDNESASYKFEGCIDKNTTAASTALVGVPVKTILSEDTTAWDVALSADTTNGGLAITVTGQASKTIRWVAHIQTVEVAG